MKTTSLTLSTYRPNFTDPRVLSRTTAVLEWCKPLRLQKKPKTVSSAELTKMFGNQKGQFAAYLRANLLAQSGTYKPGQNSYSYSIKRDGYTKLASAIGLTVKGDAEVACELYSGIASGLDRPEYSEPTKGARRYHAVQNLPKKLRAEVFKGWYDYDIEAAAPTLVYQLACEIWSRHGFPNDKTPYPAVARLVKDRTEVRKYFSDLTGLDPVTVKQVLIALFFGSKLVPNKKRAIFRNLNQDSEMVQRLKADEYVRAFCRDVELMWLDVINFDNAKKGMAVFRGESEPVKKPSTKAKHRMAIYLELERKVIDVVQSELSSQGVVPVLIHDGFMTKGRIDKSGLEGVIEQKTGYRVRLSESKVGKQDENLKFELSEDLMELSEQMF